jgi:TolB-like protein/DNA-binding winged helix-turn-helix (wHTH) protein/Tfp pilus assembly protein PilF
MSHQLHQIYEFGPYRLDAAERLLMRDGEAVPLQPKVFDLLLALVERHGHLLEKDELMKLVWPDVVVEEANLSTNISILRRTLGEDGNGRRFIETVPRRGYRFVAPVRNGQKMTVEPGIAEIAQAPNAQQETPVSAATEEAPARGAGRWAPGRPRLAVSLAVLLLLGVIGAVIFWSQKRRSDAPTDQIRSLAVIPFDNFSGDPAQEYLADGMTEALITELSKIGSLRVTSRTSVMQYKAARKPLPEIAGELSVDVIVAGSVQRSGDKIGITAQLIRATTDQHLWANQYERDLRDILSLQREVARAIAGEINVKLTPKEQGLLANARPVNPEALDAYLKGRDYFNRGINFLGPQRGMDSLKTSVSYFEQAVRIDPSFALGYAGLAGACQWLANTGGLPEFAPRAKEAAKRAVDIDETLAQAHSVLASNLFRFDWDLAGAEREYKRAIELDPNSDAHHWYATYLMYLGRFDQAIQEMNLSLELDPLTIPKRYNAALLYYWARQYDRAIEQYRRLVDTQPNNPQMHVGLGQAYMLKGMYEEGIAELRKASDLTGGDWSIYLAWGYAVSGNRSEAIKILDENLKRISSGSPHSKVNIAYVYIALGDRNQSFEWLEKAYQERSHRILVLKSEPRFDSLRSDLRYQDLLRRIGLDP